MSFAPMIGALFGLALVGAPAYAEEPATAQKPACCQEKAKAAQTFEAKVAAMNAAQGAEKLDAIAAVVNDLVAQHEGKSQQGCCGGACPMMQGKEPHQHDAPAAAGAATP